MEVPHLPVIFQSGILLDLRRGFVRFWSFFPMAPYRPSVSAPDALRLALRAAPSFPILKDFPALRNLVIPDLLDDVAILIPAVPEIPEYLPDHQKDAVQKDKRACGS